MNERTNDHSAPPRSLGGVFMTSTCGLQRSALCVHRLNTYVKHRVVQESNPLLVPQRNILKCINEDKCHTSM